MDTAQLLARPHDMSLGDAAPYLKGFATEMPSVGYTPLTIGGYGDSAIHFGGWLEAQGRSFVGIAEKTVMAFTAHRCQCLGHRSQQSVSRAYVVRVERFVQYLGRQGVIRSTVNSTPEAPSSLIAFREWLLKHRGLALVTVGRHEQLTKQRLARLQAWATEDRTVPLQLRQSPETCGTHLSKHEEMIYRYRPATKDLKRPTVLLLGWRFARNSSHPFEGLAIDGHASDPPDRLAVLGSDHPDVDFVTYLEHLAAPAARHHVGRVADLGRPVHRFALVILHVKLEQAMGIRPHPVGDDALDDHGLALVVNRAAVMRQESGRSRPTKSDQEGNDSEFLFHVTSNFSASITEG